MPGMLRQIFKESQNGTYIEPRKDGGNFLGGRILRLKEKIAQPPKIPLGAVVVLIIFNLANFR
jgi:hypothetical protein